MISNFLSSRNFRFALPYIILIIVYFSMGRISTVTRNNWDIIINFPYILLICAFILCYSFKQGRKVMVCIAMLVSYFIIQHRLQVPLYTNTTLIELSILTCLLPVSCLAVFLFNKEGFNAKSTFLYALLVGSLVFWAYLTVTYYIDGGYEDWTNGILFIEPKVSKLPLILVFYSIALICVSSLLLLRKNAIIDVIINACLVLSSATFIFFDVQYISSTMYTLIGLIIIIYSTSASHRLAFTDSLTLIPSRRALDLDLRRLGRKFTIAMIDIDHFKKFNDSYGHSVGDDVLKMVASKLSQTRGRADVYRFGGEEFTIVFQNKFAEDCVDYLEDIRELIANYQMVIRNSSHRPENPKQGKKQRGKKEIASEKVHVTVSFGVSDSRNIRNPMEIIEAADEALYQAKEAGRNCLKLNV